MRGAGVSSAGALRNISGDNTYGGFLTLAATTRINSDAGTLTLSHTGTITGATFGLTVGGRGADERVVTTLFAGNRFVDEDGTHDAGQYLGVLRADTGEGSLMPTRIGRLAAADDRLFAAVWDDPDPTVWQARFAELEPRSGRELRTLGTLWADEIRQLEIVSSGDRDVISFGVIESFGMEALEPRPRGSSVVLVSDAAGLRVLGTDAFLGALVSLPEGPTLLAAPDSQLCAESVCLGAPGNRHALRDDGGVTSHTDADRLYAARAWAAVARGDGTWLELGDG
jgi:hypothetical protein